MFQSFNLVARTSAIRNVELPLIYARVPDRRSRARRALSEVGLSEWENHLTNELSGGQQQRVAVGRCCVAEDLTRSVLQASGIVHPDSTSIVLAKQEANAK